MDPLKSQAEELEEKIGLPHGFINELRRNDDWSFIVKLHALIEASLTYAICARLNAHELEKVISHLDTSNNQCGKLAFAKQLKILCLPQRKFIRRLSELRNELVHNVHRVDFNFKSYQETLTDAENYRFCSDLSLHELLHKDYQHGEIELISIVNEIPKFGIMQAALLVISNLMVHVIKGEAHASFRELGQMLVEHLSNEPFPDGDLL